MSERGSGGARLEAFPCGKTPRRRGDTMPDIDGEPQVLLARAVELTKALPLPPATRPWLVRMPPA